jgi:hypothetical protein
MPITTRTPFGGDYAITKGKLKGVGGVLEPVSVTDLMVVYGDPGLTDQFDHISNWSMNGDNLIHESTFVAKDPSEQAKLDTWAAQIDADSEEVIREKVDAEAVADAARVASDGGERRVHKMRGYNKVKE